MPLVKPALRPHVLVLQTQVVLRLTLLVLQRVLLALDDLQPVQLLALLLGQRVKLHERLVDWRLVLRGADDVFEVLEEAVLVLGRRLGFRLCDRLDFALDYSCKNAKMETIIAGKTYLENEEPLVIQIDPSILKQCSDLREVARLVVDSVLARVALVRVARDDELGVRHHFKHICTGLRE